MAPGLGPSHEVGQDGTVHEAHGSPRPWSWQHAFPQMISGNLVTGSDPLQQNSFPQALPKHLPGQHAVPHAGFPLRHEAATAPRVAPPRSTPASRARQAVRRDPAVPKRRVSWSKVWVSIDRSSLRTLGGETNVACRGRTCALAPRTTPQQPQPGSPFASHATMATSGAAGFVASETGTV
jgi:hypothetical protein